MKNFGFARGWLLFFVCLLVALALPGGVAASDSVWVKIQLVWGTDDAKSPDSRHHPVDDNLAKKLSSNKSPFRWKHYFEVNSQVVSIPLNESRTGVKMSSHLTLDLKNLGKDKIETKLYGKGKALSTHRETVKKDWPLILAGNAENETAW